MKTGQNNLFATLTPFPDYLYSFNRSLIFVAHITLSKKNCRAILFYGTCDLRHLIIWYIFFSYFKVSLNRGIYFFKHQNSLSTIKYQNLPNCVIIVKVNKAYVNFKESLPKKKQKFGHMSKVVLPYFK